MRYFRLLAAACGVLAAGVVAEAQIFRPQDADNLEKKSAAIVQHAANANGSPLKTTITDREVNSYFKFQGAQYLPVGVVEPVVTIEASGRVTARATLDLDAVRTAKPRLITDPLAWVKGKLELRAAGILRTSNGQGTIEFESATLNGTNVPKHLLQELITFYTKTPENPGGFNLDQPFVLPQKIQRAEFQRGAVIIYQ
jgi:hypothetical protein